METADHQPIVIALGGNAIMPPDDTHGIPGQISYAARTARALVDLIDAGHRLVITHGNGPQVGGALRRVELALPEVYPLPLDICVADTQGGMGYMIAQSLNNELRRRGRDDTVISIVTAVVVDRDDPAFQRPTKPVGGVYKQEQAEQLQREQGWQMSRRADGKYRRVVPSPHPRRIVEIEVIRRLARQGQLLIAGGGGGVPVVRNDDGDLRGVEGVIDKDLTSTLLATSIGAETVVNVTGVERVALDFDTPNPRPIARMTMTEAQEYLAAGQFPSGSMGPKIEAAIEFLKAVDGADARVIICDVAHLSAALAGKSGTWIVRG